MPSHDPTVFLKHIKRNCTERSCAACTSSDSEMIICLCEEEGHSLCIECFKKYAEEYFNSGLFQFRDSIGYTLGCPGGCPNSFVTDPHHFRILGSEFYTRYKEQSAKRYVLSKGSACCPSCGVDWQITHSQRNVKSPGTWHRCLPPAGCGSLFCSSCGWSYMESGPESSCTVSLQCFCDGKHDVSMNASENSNPVWRSFILRVDGDESRKYINETCRYCPNCKSPTEKHGGCNHIHCSVCGCQWCWICREMWTSDCLSSHWL
ncbi:unnamed protein product [Schistosoma turkestanicum]|nr:unnamed protein product [Schistosoma turkestanicum]